MTNRYIALCPNCKADITAELTHQFLEDYACNFEGECPYCEAPIKVEVNPIPTFTVTEP